MLKKRLSAWETYEALPMPHWRRTDISRLKLSGLLEGMESQTAEASIDIPPPYRTQLNNGAANLLLQLNAQTIHHNVADDLGEKGIIFTDMATALKEHGDLVQDHFMTCVPPEEGKLQALHAACWNSGAFLYIPRGVSVDLPLQLLTWMANSCQSHFHHILIVAEPMSRALLIGSLGSDENSEQSLQSTVVEIIAKEGSAIDFGFIQNLHPSVSHFGTMQAVPMNDATVNWVLATLGSNLTKTTVTSKMIGRGSTSNITTLFFGSDRQHLDMETNIFHIGSHTTGDMLTKGVLKDRAVGVYRGLIDIKKGAEETKSYQTERTLLLSKTAKIDAVPALEINDSRVQASHGASISRLQEEELFYLQSRGLPRTEAERLVINGFFREVLDAFSVEAARNEIQTLIDQKILSV